jgi:D-ribulokinase
MRQAFIGVDVGTSSARAGVFDERGALLATARHPITVWHEAGNVVEQSSSEIWAACTEAVRLAMAEASLPPAAVGGIGFDATCSLVVLDAGAEPLTVSPSGEARRNVIVWMDHRAMAEARAVNDTADDVLRYVGGSISPEMEIPKLLWLKRHLPSTYDGAGHFFDLADFLSFKATGSVARSMCTLTCKWNTKDAGAGATSIASAWATWRWATTRGSASRSPRRAPRWAQDCRHPPPMSLGCSRARRSARR